MSSVYQAISEAANMVAEGHENSADTCISTVTGNLSSGKEERIWKKVYAKALPMLLSMARESIESGEIFSANSYLNRAKEIGEILGEMPEGYADDYKEISSDLSTVTGD